MHTGLRKRDLLVKNFGLIISATFNIIWGLWVGLPLSPLYIEATAVVSAVPFGAPLAIIGLVFVLVGMMQTTSIFRQQWDWLHYGSFAGAMMWTYLSLLIFQIAGWASPDVILFPYFAFKNAWLYIYYKLLQKLAL